MCDGDHGEFLTGQVGELQLAIAKLQPGYAKDSTMDYGDHGEFLTGQAGELQPAIAKLAPWGHMLQPARVFAGTGGMFCWNRSRRLFCYKADQKYDAELPTTVMATT